MSEDDRFERYPLADWSAVESALDQFGSRGTVEDHDDGITVRTGSAHVTVYRDGSVETGMPLHDFEFDDVEALYLDADDGRLRIRDEETGLSYEFRRP